MDPCWLYAEAPLQGLSRIEVRLARLPYNFQLGADADKVVLRAPHTRYGELQVHSDTCDGPLLAEVSLRPDTAAQRPQALTAVFAPQAGVHALCLYVSRRGVDPLWVIDTVQLVP